MNDKNIKSLLIKIDNNKSKIKISKKDIDLLYIVSKLNINKSRVWGLINEKKQIINLEEFNFDIINENEIYEIIYLKNNYKKIEFFNFFEKIEKIKKIKKFKDNKNNIIKILIIIDKIKFIKINQLTLDNLNFFKCYYILYQDLSKKEKENFLMSNEIIVIYINNKIFTTLYFEYKEEFIKNLFEKINYHLSENSFSLEEEFKNEYLIDNLLNIENLLKLVIKELRFKFPIDQLIKIIYIIKNNDKLIEIINQNLTTKSLNEIYKFFKKYLKNNKEIKFKGIQIEELLENYEKLKIFTKNESINLLNKVKNESINIDVLFNDFLIGKINLSKNLLTILNKDNDNSSEENESKITEKKEQKKTKPICTMQNNRNRTITFNKNHNYLENDLDSNKSENKESNIENNEIFNLKSIEEILKEKNIFNTFSDNEVILLNYYYFYNKLFFSKVNIKLRINKKKSELVNEIRNIIQDILEKDVDKNDSLLLIINNTFFNKIFIDLKWNNNYETFIFKLKKLLNEYSDKNKNKNKNKSYNINNYNLNRNNNFKSVNENSKKINNNNSLSININESPSEKNNLKKQNFFFLICNKFNNWSALKNFENNFQKIESINFKKISIDYSNPKFEKNKLNDTIYDSSNYRFFDSREADIICKIYNRDIIQDYKELIQSLILDKYCENINKLKINNKFEDFYGKIDHLNLKELCNLMKIIFKLLFSNNEYFLINFADFINNIKFREENGSIYSIPMFNLISKNFNLTLDLLEKENIDYYKYFSKNVKEFLKKEFNLNNLILMSFYQIFIQNNDVMEYLENLFMYTQFIISMYVKSGHNFEIQDMKIKFLIELYVKDTKRLKELEKLIDYGYEKILLNYYNYLKYQDSKNFENYLFNIKIDKKLKNIKKKILYKLKHYKNSKLINYKFIKNKIINFDKKIFQIFYKNRINKENLEKELIIYNFLENLNSSSNLKDNNIFYKYKKLLRNIMKFELDKLKEIIIKINKEDSLDKKLKFIENI